MTANGDTFSYRFNCSIQFDAEPQITDVALPILEYQMSDPRFEFIVGMEFLEKFFSRFHPAEGHITLEYPPPPTFTSKP